MQCHTAGSHRLWEPPAAASACQPELRHRGSKSKSLPAELAVRARPAVLGRLMRADAHGECRSGPEAGHYQVYPPQPPWPAWQPGIWPSPEFASRSRLPSQRYPGTRRPGGPGPPPGAPGPAACIQARGRGTPACRAPAIWLALSGGGTGGSTIGPALQPARACEMAGRLGPMPVASGWSRPPVVRRC